MLFFFFFSSRRRHTRSLRDWSSDVCSSDLHREAERSAGHRHPGHARGRHASRGGRSEERRVGKECRSRWSPDHERKKERKEEEDEGDREKEEEKEEGRGCGEV